MRQIYQILHGFLGDSAEVEIGAPAPSGWTFTEPPAPKNGKVAKWMGSGWELVDMAEFFVAKEKADAEALDAKRKALLKACADKRFAVQQAGKSYLFPDGATGTIQTRNETDLININGQVTAALVLQAQGVAAPALEFRDEQNATHAMTPAQMIAMGMAASQFVSATYSAKWAHDAAIAEWDGESEYDLAAGWPE